jgi:hypothetical protein
LRAQTAQGILCNIGRQSLQQFLHILDNNQLPNCPITHPDAIIAESIFGPDVGTLKGTTVHRPLEPVIITPSNLPIEIMNHYCNVTLSGDIMFVKKIPFFVTISWLIHFGTMERQMSTIF